MKIETRDIYQSDATEYGFKVAIETDESDLLIIVDGQSVCCLTSAEAKALANALRTLANMASKGKRSLNHY